MRVLISVILPLFAYLVAEWIGGPVWGLCVALAITVADLFLSWKGKGKADFKTFGFDVAVLLVLFLLDLFLERAFPGASALAVSAIMAIFMAFALTPFGFGAFVRYMDRIRPGLSRSPFVLHLMRGSLKRMLAWLCVAVALYLCAFLNRGTSFSEWVESYGLCFLLAGYIATEIIVGRVRGKRYKDVEWVALVDENGRPAGGSPRPLVHNGSHWLHAVVHLHVFDNKGRLLLQLRPKTKKIQPGKWDTAVGGHIALDEKLEDALRRETWEEIGLRDFTAQLTNRYIWDSDIEKEYVFVFHTKSNGPFEPKNVCEVDELRFWWREELEDAMSQGILTGNLEHELREGLLNIVSSSKRKR